MTILRMSSPVGHDSPEMPRAEVPPIPVLLSHVLGSLTAGLEEVVNKKQEMPSLAVWSNVLRCVVDGKRDGIDDRELPEAARISKRLAVAAVKGSARRGWLDVEPITGAGKHSRVHLSKVGWVAARAWPEKLASLDDDWKRSALRTAFEELVGQLPFELPHFPASYGTADISASGAPWAVRNKQNKKDDLPLHGTDWKPVFRGEGDTVSHLPLTALLSQALMAFTIDYENGVRWSLAGTALLLPHIDADPRPLENLPEGHGIAGNGKSGPERHGVVSVTSDPKDARRKLVALTSLGTAIKTHHPVRLDAVEKEWRERFGDRLIDDLCDALNRALPTAGDQPDHIVAPLHLG